jgi:hypothetical protein
MYFCTLNYRILLSKSNGIAMTVIFRQCNRKITDWLK